MISIELEARLDSEDRVYYVLKYEGEILEQIRKLRTGI